MKKVVLLLLVACAASSWAQDTIRYGDPWYMFRPMPSMLFTTNYNSDGTYNVFHEHNGANIALFVTETPVLVYGVAVTIHDRWLDDTNYHRTAFIFKYMDVSYRLMDSTQRRPTTPKHQLLYEGTNGTAGAYRQSVPVEEYYFDYPVWVTDTFFVGFHRMYHDSIRYGISWDFPQMLIDDPENPEVWLDQYSICGNVVDSSGVPIEQQVLRCDEFTLAQSGQSSDYTNCSIRLANYHNYGGIYPIVGFHCNKRPRKPPIMRIEATKVTFTWPEHMDGTYEMAVCERGEPVDAAFRRYVSSDRMMVFDSLIPEHPYSFWVREACIFSTASYDTLLWSPWSTTSVDITTTELEGVRVVDDFVFTLTPNPVRDRVTVTSPVPIGEVRVMDMQGRQVATHPSLEGMNGQVQLDVSELPVGVYFVHVVSTDGQQAASRRLIKF